VVVEALGERNLGFWLQRAYLRDHGTRVELQSRDDVTHSFL
jgi:hypothetical protein